MQRETTTQNIETAARDTFIPFFYSVLFICSIILCDKSGKCVSKILNGHICKGVYFYSSGKGCHNHASEAVYKSLNHKYSEIHNRLLYTGKKGKTGNFLYILKTESNFFTQKRILYQSVY